MNCWWAKLAGPDRVAVRLLGLREWCLNSGEFSYGERCELPLHRFELSTSLD